MEGCGYANWCLSKVGGDEWYDALLNQFFKALHQDRGECYWLVVIQGGDICFFGQRDLEDFRQDGKVDWESDQLKILVSWSAQSLRSAIETSCLPRVDSLQHEPHLMLPHG